MGCMTTENITCLMMKFGRNPVRENQHWYWHMFSLTIHFIYHTTHAWRKGRLRGTFLVSTRNCKEPADRWDLPREHWSHHLWRYLKNLQMWLLSIWVSGGFSSIRFTVEPDNPKGLFHPKWFYDSMKKRELKGSFPVNFILSINWYLDSWGIASHCAK